MREIISIIKKDLRESILLNPLQLIIAFAIMIFIFYSLTNLNLLKSFPDIQKIFIVFETLPILILVSLNSLMEVFYKEKMKRGFEAIMATGVSIEKIWIGKSLAIAAPMYTIYLISFFTALLLRSSSFILKEPGLLVEAIIVVPFLAFSFILLIGISFMVSEKGRTIITGVFYFFFVLLFFSNFLMKKLALLLKTSQATFNLLIFLLATILIAVATVWIKNVDTEKIILGVE